MGPCAGVAGMAALRLRLGQLLRATARGWLLGALCLLCAWSVWAAVEDGFRLDGRRTSTLGPGSCLRFVYDNTADENYVYVGGMEISILFEPDPDGAGTGGSVDVEACTQADDDADGTKDNTACSALDVFDSDADDIPDTNRLDGTAGQVGTSVAHMVAGWVRFSTTNVSNTPEVVICALAQGR